MYCPKCGSEIENGALFCDRCGYSLSNSLGTGELRGYNTNPNIQNPTGLLSNVQIQGSQILNAPTPNMQVQGNQILNGGVPNMQAYGTQNLTGPLPNMQAQGGQPYNAQVTYMQGQNSFNMNNMSKNKGLDFKRLDIKFSIAGAAFWFLAAFLPYVSADIFGTTISKSLMDGGDGWLVIIFAVAVVVALYFHKNIVRNIIVGLGVLVNLIELDVSGSDEVVAAFLQKRAGYYFLIIGSVLLIVGIVVYYVRRKDYPT